MHYGITNLKYPLIRKNTELTTEILYIIYKK